MCLEAVLPASPCRARGFADRNPTGRRPGAMTHPVRRPPHIGDLQPVRVEGATRAPSTRTSRSDRGECVQLPALDDLVDDAVGLRLLSREDLVALDVVAHALEGLAGVPGQD